MNGSPHPWFPSDGRTQPLCPITSVVRTSPFRKDDARLDLTDVFAFSAPADLDRIVLIMDANTFATGSEFHPDAVYQLMVDTDNDNEPDITFSAVSPTRRLEHSR